MAKEHYFDRDKLEAEILKTDVEVYKSPKNTSKSINFVAETLEFSALKARKLLITAGEREGDAALYYSTGWSETVQRLYKEGKDIKEIERETKLSHASVVGYLPYTKTVYTMKQISVDAERIKRFRERQHAIATLSASLASSSSLTYSSSLASSPSIASDGKLEKTVNTEKKGNAELSVDSGAASWRAKLWTAITLYQNFKFKTAGRGKDHKGAVEFTYSLKISSRTGETTDELIISTRPDGKSITRSSVELALTKAVEVQAECGCVKGPKACGQIFGISYLYAIFLHWGIITSTLTDEVNEVIA